MSSESGGFMAVITMKQQAERLAEVVKDYQDSTARAHACPGFDCKVCAFNGGRFVELSAAILDDLEAYQAEV
jgi:hypothetical protein